MQLKPANDERMLPDNLLVEDGERDAAVEYVKEWLGGHLADSITIVDPYFTPADLDILKLIGEVNPECNVAVITSRQGHIQSVKAPWDAAYEAEWRRISNQIPPETRVIIVGSRGADQSPIHDRWWLSGGHGLEFGVSWNGLGKRASTIRQLRPSEVATKQQLAEELALQLRKEFRGERLTYTTLSL
jgi:hypothetical protein